MPKSASARYAIALGILIFTHTLEMAAGAWSVPPLVISCAALPLLLVAGSLVRYAYIASSKEETATAQAVRRARINVRKSYTEGKLAVAEGSSSVGRLLEDVSEHDRLAWTAGWLDALADRVDGGSRGIAASEQLRKN